MGMGNYTAKCDDLLGNIMNDTFKCSRATPVLMKSPDWLIYQNFVQDTTMNDQISLLLLWMYKLARQQSNLKLLAIENL